MIKQKWITGILAGLAALTAGGGVLYMTLSDREEPVIAIQGELQFREGEDSSRLLEGVTASDNRDGDLTASLQVETLIPLAGGDQAKVFYMVMDSAGNIAKASRIIGYSGGTENIPEESSPQEETPAETEPAQTDEQETEAPASETETAETAPAETEPANPEAPVLELSQTSMTVPVGGNFPFQSVIASISDDKDTEEELYSQIMIDGNYNVNQPGTYELRFYVLDSDGNLSPPAAFQLIVQ